MSASRKRRRADGKLRPAVLRARERKRRRRRQAWLANFAPGDRDRFFRNVDLKEAIFLSAFARVTGVAPEVAAGELERIADERRWRKLRTLDGVVVGIAPPRPVVHAPPST